MGTSGTDKDAYRARIGSSVGFLLAGVLLPILFRHQMFYLDPPKDSWNFYRYLWCCSGTFVGFASLAWAYREEKGSPYVQFATLYLPQLFAVAALVCGGLHLFNATSGFVFYYLSFGLSVMLGFRGGDYLRPFLGLVSKAVDN